MIGRWSKKQEEEIVEGPKGFDDFQLRLGDMMRGERATMGKSLLDVQRELRIKASYIAAIENCDPEAFETQGFVAGYVRSYARYLDLDPDATFAQFCAESGFASAHGMDEAAKPGRKSGEALGARALGVSKTEADPFANPTTPFLPKEDSVFARMEPGAIGSMTVLIALIAALGYGGWSVLQEVQRVQLAPVEQTPVVLSELDPLQGVTTGASDDGIQTVAAQAPNGGVTGGSGVFTPPSAEGLDRLYRPQALDVPVLIARDAPISSLDPSQFGAFADSAEIVTSPADAAPEETQQLAGLGQGVKVMAVRPAWVRIRDGGEVIFTGIMNAGDTYDVPVDAFDASIEVGESGSVYYAVNGETYGPTGPRGTVTNDLGLEPAVLAAALPKADIQADSDLSKLVASLGGVVPRSGAVPQVLDGSDKTVTVVAARQSWVRVRSTSGTVLFEGTMEPGGIYTVPATEEAPVIRAGNAGAIFFVASGQVFGPYGNSGEVKDRQALSTDAITTDFAVAEVPAAGPVAQAVAELNASRISVDSQ